MGLTSSNEEDERACGEEGGATEVDGRVGKSSYEALLRSRVCGVDVECASMLSDVM